MVSLNLPNWIDLGRKGHHQILTGSCLFCSEQQLIIRNAWQMRICVYCYMHTAHSLLQQKSIKDNWVFLVLASFSSHGSLGSQSVEHCSVKRISISQQFFCKPLLLRILRLPIGLTTLRRASYSILWTCGEVQLHWTHISDQLRAVEVAIYVLDHIHVLDHLQAFPYDLFVVLQGWHLPGRRVTSGQW